MTDEHSKAVDEQFARCVAGERFEIDPLWDLQAVFDWGTGKVFSHGARAHAFLNEVRRTMRTLASVPPKTREAVVWWHEGHWRVWFDGEMHEAAGVAFKNGKTDLKEDGFKEYPGGPRGVIRGELMAWEPFGANDV
jgi:hypothetical protein